MSGSEVAIPGIFGEHSALAESIFFDTTTLDGSATISECMESLRESLQTASITSVDTKLSSQHVAPVVELALYRGVKRSPT